MAYKKVVSRKATTVRIWDLDRTLIDSDHRTPSVLNFEGLAEYRAMQTHTNIMKDTALPLMDQFRKAKEIGDVNIVLTARCMTKSDHISLRNLGITGVKVINRNKCASHDHFNTHDSGEYKRVFMQQIKEAYPNAKAIYMYDDHPKVLKVADELGIIPVNAITLNKLLA